MTQVVDKVSNSITNIPYLNLVCSILVLAIFFVAGIKKTQSFAQTQGGITKKIGKFFKGLPEQFYKLLTGLVIAIELLAPLAIVYSLMGTTNATKQLTKRTSLLILIIFIIIATLLYHSPTDPNETMSFLRNIGIIGALLLMLKHL